jgi:hypothetical protein
MEKYADIARKSFKQGNEFPLFMVLGELVHQIGQKYPVILPAN